MQPSRRYRRTARVTQGFTLVEMMVAVAIIGILSSISIPIYTSYLYRSKTTEAVGFLAEIKSRQEAYRSEYHLYCDASVNAKNWWPDGTPYGGLRRWDGGARPAGWDDLGVAPPGRMSLFSYVSVAGNIGAATLPMAAGFSSDYGYTGSDYWFVSAAEGDLDGDGTKVTFESYSHSTTLWISNEKGWE